LEFTFVSCGKYIQGRGVVEATGTYMANLGRKCLVITDEFVLRLVKEPMVASFHKAGIEALFEVFNGECSRPEIDRLVAIVNSSGAEVIMGAGGGKALDICKAVAFETQKKCAIFPTIAATDSPTTSIAVLYAPDHTYQGVLKFAANPALVLVDTEIVVKAPARFLIAGMGDALATKFEARACYLSATRNLPGGYATMAGLALADLTYDVIRQHGLSALLAVEQGIVTPAFEKIVEANILLSGLGWENCGVAVAHGFHGALTIIPRTHRAFHGEKVAFGVLTQLILEGRPYEEITDLIGFYREIGLPVTLADLGMDDATEAEIVAVATQMARPGSHAHNMPFPITVSLLKDAIIAADQMGRSR
jgi:glycerol dehydrogenase